MQRVQWLTYQNKRILFADCTHLTQPEYLQIVEELVRVVSELEPGTELLDMGDITGSKTNYEIRKKLRDLAAIRGELTGASAMIGLSPFSRKIASILRPQVKFAATIEEAKEWLVAQSST
jgi:hypothetical protein